MESFPRSLAKHMSSWDVLNLKYHSNVKTVMFIEAGTVLRSYFQWLSRVCIGTGPLFGLQVC